MHLPYWLRLQTTAMRNKRLKRGVAYDIRTLQANDEPFLPTRKLL